MRSVDSTSAPPGAALRSATGGGPVTRIEARLPPSLRRVADRPTPIPTLAQAAQDAAARYPSMVRGDIGQVVGCDPGREVLYGPPVGLTSLRAALAETYNLSFRLADGPSGRLDARHVAVCTGAAEGLSLLLRCVAFGGRVAVQRGHWENYDNAISLADAEPIVIDLFDAEGRLALDALAPQLDGVDTLLANFPCNPTGAVLDEAETRALAAFAVERDLLVIADDVYARLRYDGEPPQTLLRYAPEHAVSVASASKEYLLPGARVGYVVSASADLTDRILRRLIRASTASPSVLGQEKLLESLLPDLDDLRAGRPPAILSRIIGEMDRRRQALLTVLDRHGMARVGRPGHEPMGTIFAVAELPRWWTGDDTSFAEAAIAAGCFSGIPGAAFGLPGAIRFSFGGMTPDDIARLDGQLDALRERTARA